MPWSRVLVNGVGCLIRSSMSLQLNFSANAVRTVLAHEIDECLGCAAALTSMALRNLCSRIGQQKSSLLQPFVEGRRWQSSPTVFDKLVDILVFDTQGHRHKLRGRQGQTLVELLADNGDVLGDEVVGLSPEGRGVLEALVTIPNDYLDQIPAPDAQDLRSLEELSPTGAAVSKNARLASKIKLTAALNDVHIALSPLQPWKTL